jgi:multisubunit Na+/H+ antiporter MnhC subunit
MARLKKDVSWWKPKDYGNAIEPDELKELRAAAMTFFKFDLAYIAALGTIATVLHLEPAAIPATIVDFSLVIYSILGLVLLDSLIIWQLGNLWLTAKTGRTNTVPQIVQRGVARIAPAQPVVHAFVLYSIVLGMVAISTALTEYRQDTRTMATIQDELDALISQSGKVPATIDELAAQRPRVAAALKKLSGKEKLTLVPTGGKGYVLQLGSEGLKVRESGVKVRDIIDEVEGHGKGHQ